MITIESTSMDLWNAVRDLIKDQLPSVLEGSLLIRVNGSFTALDRDDILEKVRSVGITVRQCEVYNSAVEEANRMELLLSGR